jgi:threonyl-tRNA synthetase
MSKKSPEEKAEQLHKMRHSLAHIMAEAVQSLFPEVKFGIGPVIDNGFYYDFDLPRTLIPEDLPLIEAKMAEIIKAKNPFERQEVSKAEALAFFQKANEPYKLELIADLNDGEITLYRSGKFVDLCRGPHVENTAQVGAFKLTHIAGAYWKGDEKNKMLQRIYGVAFADKKELKQYLAMVEEAKKRDHRKLGKDLDLFTISPLVGRGLPLLTERGATIYRELERFIIDEEMKRGYKHVKTPELARTALFEKSGHYPYYADNMYPKMVVDENEVVLRPVTCPHHFEVYGRKAHSYRDLPVRIAETANLYRYEQSGELSGLIRVMSFCLADSHIVCTKEQAKEEIKRALDLIEYANGIVLGFKKGDDYSYRLSLGDRENKKKYHDDKESWDFSEIILEEVLQELELPYATAKDEAAFYGPKIDIQMKNVLGKEDTVFTVQYDCFMPGRFGLTYTDENGQDITPVVIHRSSIGCIQRTMAYLIEKYAGIFPLWLAPEQVRVIPVLSDKNMDYARGIAEQLRAAGFRVEVDRSTDTLGKKIRNAELMKVNYMLVVGDKDIEAQTVSVRPLTGDDLGALPLADFLAMISQERDRKMIKQDAKKE